MNYLTNIFASGLDTLDAFQQKIRLEYLLKSLTHSISMIPIFTTARARDFFTLELTTVSYPYFYIASNHMCLLQHEPLVVQKTERKGTKPCFAPAIPKKKDCLQYLCIKTKLWKAGGFASGYLQENKNKIKSRMRI